MNEQVALRGDSGGLKEKTRLFRYACPVAAASALLLVMALSHEGSSKSGSTWTEASFEDFRDGSFLDAGSNIYVSARGRVQMISRWDLNGDGHLDVVLPSGHGHTEKENNYVYLNNGGDIDGRSRIELPGSGSRDGLVADFNKDGLNDLVVVNKADSHFRRVSSWIFWGTRTGISTQVGMELPAFQGLSAAAGDFNRDGWTDLAIACQWQDGTEEQPKGPVASLIYWNSPEGFRADRRLPLTFDGETATAVAAGDLDGDGSSDLVVLTATKTWILASARRAFDHPDARQVLALGGNAAAIGNFNGDRYADLGVSTRHDVAVLLGTETGIGLSGSIRLPVDSPSDLAVADVDADGLDDIVVASSAAPGGAQWTDSLVYYSARGGFSTRDPLRLPTLGASAVSVADLNGDRLPEIVISNQNVTNQKSLLSYVYWNEGGRFRFGNHSQLATQGSSGNAIGDINGDSQPDVIFFNEEGGFRDGAAESAIYWGNGTRNFSIARRRAFPTHQIFGYGHADLDDNDFMDLIFCQSNFIYGVKHDQSGLIFYWGDPAGFQGPSNLSMEQPDGGVLIADLNRDGFLDLLAAGTSADLQDPARRGMPIFWGSKQGFRHQARTLLHVDSERMRAPLLMDLNRDGWLDIAGQAELGKARIWWGKAEGFSDSRFTDIDLGRQDQLMYVKGADFNKDGWLDLFLPKRGAPDGTETSSFIYYGSAEGFSNNRRVEVASYVPYQNSVADINRDGWLDLVLTSYGGEVSGNRPSLIYWGGQGGFAKSRRTELPTYGSSGSLTADFDGDGWLDILFANHRRSSSTIVAQPHRHTTESMLYWGGDRGFSPANRWEVQAAGPSGLNLRDLGNSYDRGLYEDYISSAHAMKPGEIPSAVSWKAETPHGSSVRLQVRAAAQREGLDTAPWQGPDGTDSWFTTSGGRIRGLSGAWIQYRARLATPNGSSTPYLTSVTIAFDR